MGRIWDSEDQEWGTHCLYWITIKNTWRVRKQKNFHENGLRRRKNKIYYSDQGPQGRASKTKLVQCYSPAIVQLREAKYRFSDSTAPRSDY